MRVACRDDQIAGPSLARFLFRDDLGHHLRGGEVVVVVMVVVVVVP